MVLKEIRREFFPTAAERKADIELAEKERHEKQQQEHEKKEQAKQAWYDNNQELLEAISKFRDSQGSEGVSRWDLRVLCNEHGVENYFNCREYIDEYAKQHGIIIIEHRQQPKRSFSPSERVLE